MRFLFVHEEGGLVTVARAFTYMNLVVVTETLLVVLLARPAIELLTTTPCWRASVFVPPLVLAYVMLSWSGTLDLSLMGLIVTERTKQVARANWSAALVILALYGLLIPTWVGMGGAIATLIAFSLRTWLVDRWSQQAQSIPYNWAQISRRLMSFALAAFALAALLPSAPWAPQVAERLVLFACYLLSTWLLVLYGDERPRARIPLRGLALMTRLAGA
jgi:O-antigen/teichoic acid export membrane protein